MPRKGKGVAEPAPAARWFVVDAVFKYMCDAMGAARSDVDAQGSSEDAGGLAPAAHDVEGAGACGLFAMAGAADARAVAHMEPANEVDTDGRTNSMVSV